MPIPKPHDRAAWQPDAEVWYSSAGLPRQVLSREMTAEKTRSSSVPRPALGLFAMLRRWTGRRLRPIWRDDSLAPAGPKN